MHCHMRESHFLPRKLYALKSEYSLLVKPELMKLDEFAIDYSDHAWRTENFYIMIHYKVEVCNCDDVMMKVWVDCCICIYFLLGSEFMYHLFSVIVTLGSGFL